MQYALTLYDYFKEWRKNPHWSFSCCLALLLTLNDLQGDIGGLSETNALKFQLDTGEFSVPTFLDAVKHSGAVDVSLEEDEEGDGSTVEARDSYQYAEHRNKRSHKGTQTNPFSLPITDIGAHKPIRKARGNSREYNAGRSKM